MNILINGKLIRYNSPIIMGIVNYTNDSFYSGSRCETEDDVLQMAERHVSEGCDWLDVGAASTRPGAADVDTKIEIERATAAISIIRRQFSEIPISVDTWSAKVAEAAVSAGANIINDISGGSFDSLMFQTAASLKVPYILTHTSAKPDIMQNNTQYDNVLSELFQFFGDKIHKLKNMGVDDVIIDPGFGFGKTIEQNYKILDNLSFFGELGCPILAGLSRKSMIYKALNTTPENSLNGTSVLNFVALQNGADILRVHDVKAAKEVVRLFSLLNVPDKGADTL